MMLFLGTHFPNLQGLQATLLFKLALSHNAEALTGGSFMRKLCCASQGRQGQPSVLELRGSVLSVNEPMMHKLGIFNRNTNETRLWVD